MKSAVQRPVFASDAAVKSYIKSVCNGHKKVAKYVSRLRQVFCEVVILAAN
jgi:hypothetical protein